MITRMTRLVAAAALGAGAWLAGPAGAPAALAPTGAPAAVTATSGSVPLGFAAQSVSWADSSHGWVLGTAPCGRRQCTDVLASRSSGGSWSLLGTVRAPLARPGHHGVQQIRMADRHRGWAFGPDLYATATAGSSWTPVPIPGRGRQVLALAANHDATYLVTSACPIGSGACGTPLRLWRTPTAHPDRWRLVAVDLPSNFTAILALHGRTVYVADPMPGEKPDRFYAATDGRTFGTRPDPCDNTQAIALADIAATAASHVNLLCVGNVGLGKSLKTV